MKPTIGFVGMTHLGLVSGVCAAAKGFQVVCFDPDLELIAQMRQGVLPVSEPQLYELLTKNSDRILLSTDIDDLMVCDVVYVAPDVATDHHGNSNLCLIDTLLELVLKVMSPDSVIVILSQVPPGYTRAKQQPGRSLYYQVETLIFGRAVERALYPERTIVGCYNPHDALPASYAEFLSSHNCPILPMRYESAELTKISINMCLVASISVANTMAEICEKIGADWFEIAPALRLDKRIGQYAYLSPGLGIAGGNLERDLATVCNFADRYNTDAGVVRAWISNNHHRRGWALRTLSQETISKIKDPVIAVLGLAYKKDTNSIKNSPSIELLDQLKQFRLRVFDPVVETSLLSSTQCYAASSELEACEGADALVVMTPWSQFGLLDPLKIAKKMRGKVVLDPYAVLGVDACQSAGLRHHTLGVQAR